MTDLAPDMNKFTPKPDLPPPPNTTGTESGKFGTLSALLN